jgi:PAS domain S-box-containing protein
MRRTDILYIVFGYALIAGLYILFSDRLLYALVPDASALQWVSIAKGLCFVAVTALTLWWLMQRLQSDEQARYQALVENHQAIMMLIDPADGAIVDCNKSAADFYGYSLQKLRLLNITDINHLDIDRVRSIASAAIANRNVTLRLRHWCADGSTRDVLVQTGPVFHRGRCLLLSIIRDETLELANQQALKRLLALHTMLSRANQLLITATSRDQLFDQLCRIAVEVGGFRFAWMGLLDSHGSMQPVARAGVLPLPVEDQLSPQAWRTALDAGGFACAIAIALRSKADVIGTFELFTDDVNFFGSAELDTLYLMIDDLALGLANLSRIATLEVATDVVESSPVVLFRVDDLETWHVSFVTENVSRWGYNAASLLSGLVRFDQIAHPEDLVKMQREAAGFLREGRSEFTQVYRVLTAHGESRWVEDKTSVRYDKAGKLLYTQGALTDITERYNMQTALQQSESRYRTMISNSPDILFINSGGIIAYMNPAGLRLLGAMNEADLLGKPVFSIFHADCHAQVRERIAIARAQPGVAMPLAVLPLVALDGRILHAEISSSSFIHDGSIDFLVFCHDITYRMQADRTISAYVERLEKAMLATTAAVSQLVELRDPYTAGHERRVGDIAAAIAAELGLDDNVQRGLRVAGALHDVGKISVPTEILAKPGPLTRVEFELVKQHARQGYQILAEVDFPWPVAQVAHQHHERLDGSGYPRGLRGDEILLEARITAVADVVESMSSHRPYRPSRGLDEALAEIEQGRATRYDAAVVDACLRLFRDKHYRLPA